jgi:hypothetical protein
MTTLKWHGPFSFNRQANLSSVFDCDHARSSGIYLWTVPYKDGFLVYYVGETGATFGVRLKQEYDRFYNGQEYLVHIPDFKVGNPARHVYKPRGAKGVSPDFAPRQIELRAVADEMLSTMRVFLEPIELSKEDRLLVERGTVWNIWDSGGRSDSFLSNWPQGYGKTKPTITLVHESACKIWGLTAKLIE